MPVKIQTRPINQNVLDDLLTAGADPLIARLCASRDVQSPAELDDKLAGLLPYQSLTNCEAAARRLADAIERKEKILIVADYDADQCHRPAPLDVGHRTADHLPHRHAEHKRAEALLDKVDIRFQTLRHFGDRRQVRIDRKRHQCDQHRHQNGHLLAA